MYSTHKIFQAPALVFQSYHQLFLSHWKQLYGSRVSFIWTKEPEIILFVVKKNLSLLLTFIKFDWFHQFAVCIDIVTYDQPGKKLRFTIIYYLLSVVYNNRFHVVSQVSGLQGLETIYMLYKSANWSEREIWDMFGILFYFHPDLRRIITDYGFLGFPLRKNFPVSGYKELFYSDSIKNTKYRAVEILQARRDYSYAANWVKKNKK